jgi:hypothetical protein
VRAYEVARAVRAYEVAAEVSGKTTHLRHRLSAGVATLLEWRRNEQNAVARLPLTLRAVSRPWQLVCRSTCRGEILETRPPTGKPPPREDARFLRVDR